jgi:hypothetical protein
MKANEDMIAQGLAVLEHSPHRSPVEKRVLKEVFPVFMRALYAEIPDDEMITNEILKRIINPLFDCHASLCYATVQTLCGSLGPDHCDNIMEQSLLRLCSTIENITRMDRLILTPQGRA